MLKKVFYNIFLGIITITHFFVTLVVVLCVLSTLNILNERILHLVKLDFLEILVTVVIFTSSTVVFCKSFKKTSHLIRNSFFSDLKR